MGECFLLCTISGEPNNVGGRELCVAFWGPEGYPGGYFGWNDAPCEVPFYFVCEKEDKVNLFLIVLFLMLHE